MVKLVWQTKDEAGQEECSEEPDQGLVKVMVLAKDGNI